MAATWLLLAAYTCITVAATTVHVDSAGGHAPSRCRVTFVNTMRHTDAAVYLIGAKGN